MEKQQIIDSNVIITIALGRYTKTTTTMMMMMMMIVIKIIITTIRTLINLNEKKVCSG